MSFQFVNTTADKRKPDEKTRKKIRSQVMKDFRRRQEEESGMPGPSTSLQASSLRPTSVSRSPRPSLSRSLSGQGSRQQSPDLVTPPGEALGGRSAKRGRPDKTQRMQAASLFLQTAHGLFANFTVDLPAKRETEAEDLTRDDSEQNRMLEICAKYNEWLGAEGSGTARSLAPVAARGGREAEMQLYALTMNAIGHLHAVGVFSGEDERAYYKARLLSIANELLQDPSKALEDGTLASLACLTSYEISFNSHEALTHLNGISRIIASRGGLESLSGDPSLPVMLQGLDLSHALYFNTEPVFTTTRFAHRLRSDSSRRLRENAHERHSSSDSMEGDGAEEDVRRWQDTLREASSFLREHGSSEASRACYLAWRIHLFQPRSTEAWSAQSITEMDELFTLLTSMPSDDWQIYPALHARVILTALATATETAHKSWYYTHLSRLMFHTESQYWEDFKNLVADFIESQAYFRRPNMETVKVMVSGVEIIVERTLAQQMGLQIV